MSELKCTRPVVRYHGGKWNLAKWIMKHFPPHRVYVEPFAGAASVLLQKPRSYAEVYNDLDGEIVNVFTVLRDPVLSRELERGIRLTPFSRVDFGLSYKPCEDRIEQARRTIARAFMGFGSNSHNRLTGFRSNSNRSGTTPAHDWMHYPDQIKRFCERLAGVVIENRPAIEVIERFDSAETLFYVDPPYVATTRREGQYGNYRHEMTDVNHAELATVLRRLKGNVVLSGYDCPLYDDLYEGWNTIRRVAFADGARERIETLWTSFPAEAQERLELTE